MSWYALFRVAHSYWRWVVLVAGAIAFARAVAGAWGQQEWAPADDRVGRLFIATLDIQFLLGLVLYFGFSPFWPALYESFSETMRDQAARFFGIEHQTAMVGGIAAAHIGWTRVRRASEGPAKHRVMLVGLLVFFVFALWAIPWPWRPYGRPLFRTEW